MAGRKRKHKPYDYRLLVAEPKVFGFFVGWFGQRLFSAIHVLQTCLAGQDTRKLWDMWRNEVCRLAAMLHAWCYEHNVQISQELVDSLTTLHRDLGPEGYRTSVQAIGGPADLGDCRFSMAGDGRHDLDDGYFPNILAEDHGMPGEFGQLCTKLRNVVLQIGRTTGQDNAVGLGAGVSGVAHALATAHITGSVHTWIQGVVDIGLLESGTGIEDDVAPYTGMELDKALEQASAVFLGAPDSDWKQLKGELATLPAAICTMHKIDLPPGDSDTDTLPDLDDLVSVADESPSETTETAPQSEPPPAESADSAGSRLTLMEFVRDHCEVTGAKMSPKLLKSRVDSLMSAARRGEVELPPCQSNWHRGQSKKYRFSDLQQRWPELCRTWPGLPTLKK